jgi:hypothetical protein
VSCSVPVAFVMGDDQGDVVERYSHLKLRQASVHQHAGFSCFVGRGVGLCNFSLLINGRVPTMF